MDKETKRRKARKFLRSFSTFDRWLVVDTETTGADDETDDIVEVAVLTAGGAPLVDSLVQPYNSISEGAQDVHGIGPEDVKDAPTMDELLVLDFLFSAFPILIYNRGFDGPILRNAFRYRDVDVDPEKWDLRCVMKAYAMAEGEWDDYHGSFSWVKLEEAAREQGVSTDGIDLHRAGGDAELTRRLVRSFADEREPEPAA